MLMTAGALALALSQAATAEMPASPVPVHAAAPVYPSDALMSGKEGWVRLAFTIQHDGSVADVRVVESEPGRLFNAAATRALERWRFDPADAGAATYTIEFKIGDGP